MKELLFYLVSHPARTKAQIGLALWPDVSRKQLRNSLGITLYHLRRTLDGPHWIIFEDDLYRFNRTLDYWYDVDVFEANLMQASRRQTQTPDRAISTAATDGFFAPFLRGIFLERELSTSSHVLDFVLGTFSSGPAVVPYRGMAAIPELLADGVEVRTGSPVAEATPGWVRLASGESLEAGAVVVATAGLIDEAPAGWNGVCCLYFDAPSAPLPGAWLVLDGDGAGPVNNLTS